MASRPVSDTPAFKIRRSVIAGRGAFALRDIKKGERLIEYVGERISHPVADDKYDDAAKKSHHTFLFSVSSRTVIDASVGGNDSRFINHSCAPNCEAVIERRRVFIFAKRPITKGDELAYDYGYERDGSETAADEKLYGCRCGTSKCRGTILAPKKPPRKKKHHALARHTEKVKAG
ncbi:MAG: SET domain-containing protein-lysine N-methyltransferase [Gemmatimonadetes bacterium]|nr:SET domain-containing protein-lysine N-methyltransferase [Gemmatimonadota bacterium]